MDGQVTALYCYPIKSCRGITLERAEVGLRGIAYDRQWMVVDERGMFVAQRQGAGGLSRGLGVGIKSMCLITTAFEGDHLVLYAPHLEAVHLPLRGQDHGELEVRVWQSRCRAFDQGDEASRWLTTVLSWERPGTYRLVRMADEHVRTATLGTAQLGFADAYPFLIISQASLADLNARMAEALPMDRFRPNIVLEGCAPYAEDHMARVRIGAIEFEGETLCVRCATTTTNQLTAERGPEPLRTLATYRRIEAGGVIFGRNFNHCNTGALRVGDPVHIVVRD